MEWIRNSFNKLSQNTNPGMSNKQSISTRRSISNNPTRNKLSPLETLPHKSIDSFTSRNNTPNPSGLVDKSSKFVSQTYNNTLSFFNIKNYLFIFGIIMVVALFGVNIFTYLSQITNYLTGLVRPIFSTSGNIIGNATKSTIKATSTGTQQIIETGSDTTKNIIDATEKVTTSGIDYLQGSLKKNVSAVKPENNDPETDYVNKPVTEPEPSRTSSSSNGYCYIGSINDTRRCAKVDTGDKCMSGDIYPTMDICINPNIKV